MVKVIEADGHRTAGENLEEDRQLCLQPRSLSEDSFHIVDPGLDQEVVEEIEGLFNPHSTMAGDALDALEAPGSAERLGHGGGLARSRGSIDPQGSTGPVRDFGPDPVQGRGADKAASA